MSPYLHGNSHYRDEPAIRLYYLLNGISQRYQKLCCKRHKFPQQGRYNYSRDQWKITEITITQLINRTQSGLDCILHFIIYIIFNYQMLLSTVFTWSAMQNQLLTIFPHSRQYCTQLSWFKLCFHIYTTRVTGTVDWATGCYTSHL